MKTATLTCYNGSTDATLYVEENRTHTIHDGMYEALRYADNNGINVKHFRVCDYSPYDNPRKEV